MLQGGSPAADGDVGYRLIFSDGMLGGGQVVKTFTPKPTSIKQVVANLRECQDFMFEDICTKRNVDKRGMRDKGNSIYISGLDGSLRKPLRTDEDVAKFLFYGCQNTALPSLEVELVNARSRTSGGVDASGKESRAKAADYQEQLEDENTKLKAAALKTERQLAELDRRVTHTHEHADAIVSHLRNEFTRNLKDQVTDLNGKIAKLSTETFELRKDLKETKAHLQKVEKTDLDGYNFLHAEHTKLDESTADRFQNVNNEIQDLKLNDVELKEEDERINLDLKKHKVATEVETKRLDSVKVEITKWREEEDQMDARMKAGFEDAAANLKKAREELEASLKATHEELLAADAALEKWAHDNSDATHKRIDEEQTKMGERLDAGFERAEVELNKLREVMGSSLKNQVDMLTDTLNNGIRDLSQKITVNDSTIHRKTDALTQQTELSFKQFQERLEEMAKVERNRFASIEKNFTEVMAKTRSDMRIEVERLRGDTDQEQARLDQDLTDLHTKHDLTSRRSTFSSPSSGT